MNKLTQQEAQIVLQEAYRLKAEYAESKSRLGQSIWWVASRQKHKCLSNSGFYFLLENKITEDIDFFHYTDDNKVLEVFYEHFVEKG